MLIENIKLVIWDLDETFWNGVLSDNNVTIKDENVNLIRNMVDAGVMCSICSKNDEAKATEYLQNIGIDNLFVFKSINWTQKGKRIKQIITEMGLREVNVLFLDDNPTNRAEAIEVCPQINTEDEKYIKELIKYYETVEKKDLKHKRLEQYRILEKKNAFKATVGTNEDFLLQSNIQVEIHDDCIEHIDRIYELIQRSNQLNFTKNRSEKNELINLIRSINVETGYVTVRDNFGDYGLVGFYAITEERLVHFVFSCRILNMGVEQYVYKCLGKPSIEIVGDVSSDINDPNPYWISNGNQTQEKKNEVAFTKKILLKGPCDISQIASYLSDNDMIVSELTYVNNDGISIEGHNHTSHIIQSFSLDSSTKEYLARSLPFGDMNMYSTSIFDDDIGVAFYSLFTDPNLGLYKNKSNGALVAFGEYTNDLTDEQIWNKLINHEVFTAGCKFTEDSLRNIKRDYVFIGRLMPNQVFENIKEIFSKMNRQSILVLNLGSETPYKKNTQIAYDNREKYHQELNALIRNWAETEKRVKIIDVNDYITGQDSYINNINHFNRKIYYQMSIKLVQIINETMNEKVKSASWIKHEIRRWTGIIRRIPSKILNSLNPPAS